MPKELHFYPLTLPPAKIADLGKMPVEETTSLCKRNALWDLPGGPAVKTPHFQCRGYRFDPWSKK